ASLQALGPRQTLPPLHETIPCLLLGVESMASSRRLPAHAVHVPTYVVLEQYVRAFAAGHLHLLMLFGPPGVGKSHCVRQALDRHVGWINGQATPRSAFGMRWSITDRGCWSSTLMN